MIQVNKDFLKNENYIKAVIEKAKKEMRKKQARYNRYTRSSNRKDYQEICRYLRRMKKLGGNDACKDLIRKIQTEYPRRPALLEELCKV